MKEDECKRVNALKRWLSTVNMGKGEKKRTTLSKGMSDSVCLNWRLGSFIRVADFFWLLLLHSLPRDLPDFVHPLSPFHCEDDADHLENLISLRHQKAKKESSRAFYLFAYQV